MFRGRLQASFSMKLELTQSDYWAEMYWGVKQSMESPE